MNPSLSPASIVTTCSDLSWKPRHEYIISLGRTSTKSIAHKQAIQDLSAGPLYNRILALRTVYGSRDSALALHLLQNDPSRQIQQLATKIVALCAPDDGIVDAAKGLEASILTSLICELCGRKRQVVVDAIVLSLAPCERWNEKLFMKVLPFASESYVEKVLFDDQLVDRVDWRRWRKYAKCLPRIAYRVIMEAIQRSESYAYHVFVMVSDVLPFLTKCTEAELGNGRTAVDVLRALLNKPWVGMKEHAFPNLQCLIDRYPKETLQLLLTREERLNLYRPNKFKEFELAELEGLYKHQPDAIPAFYLKDIPKEKRVAIYKLAENHWRQRDGYMPIFVVRNLPEKERVQEARFQLGLERIETRPQEKMQFAALLPWKEGLEINMPYIQSSDIEVRAAALREQIFGVRYQRQQLGVALDMVVKRRYENEIVRQEMLNSLEKLPPSVWKEEHMEDLKRCYEHAFDAADLAHVSQGALWRLAKRLLGIFPGWASLVIAKLITMGWRLQNTSTCFYRSTPKSALNTLSNEVVPILRQWAVAKRTEDVMLVGVYFSDVLDYVPDIVDILEDVLLETITGHLAGRTIQSIQSRTPERIPGLIQRLFDNDPSFIYVPNIENYLNQCSPSLLDKYLIEAGWKGRYSNGKLDIVQFALGKLTWTAAQQDLYANTLSNAVSGRVYSDSEVVPFINLLAELPYSEKAVEALKEFASDGRQVVRDVSLKALACLDEGKGVSTLLEALGDDRARVAIYALRNVMLKQLAPDRALEILRNTKTKSITVAKEIVRLVGDLDTNDAFEYLLEKEKDPNLHVDVHMAVLRRLWTYDKRDEVIPIFERAVVHEHSSVLKTIAELPIHNLANDRMNLLARLISKLLSHPSAEVRMTALNRLDTNPILMDNTSLQWGLEQIILSSRKQLDILQLAARVYFRNFLSSGSASLPVTPSTGVNALFCEILRTRDYFTLKHVFHILVSYPTDSQLLLPTRVSTIKQVLEILKKDKVCQTLCVGLIFRLPGPDLHRELLEIAPSLHADALVEAEKYCQALTKNIKMDLDLSRLEDDLWKSRDEKSRRLGLDVLVALSRSPNGWARALRERLNSYRMDKSILVAEAATFVFPPDQETS
jgi:HEAT repeat protein